MTGPAAPPGGARSSGLAGRALAMARDCDGPGRGLIDGDVAWHIIFGNKTGGGHKWPGNPCKTVFPPSWDTDRILDAIADVTTDPGSTWTWQEGARGSLRTNAGNPSVVKIEGVRDGVKIRVIYVPLHGHIKTGFPYDGPRNPCR